MPLYPGTATTAVAGTVILDGTATDIAQVSAAAAAGASGKAADAAHVHADPSPTPADFGYITWNGDPLSSSTTNLLVAGTIYLAEVYVRTAQTVTNILIEITTVGATLTAGQNFAALYDSTGTQQGITADQSGAWTGSGTKTMALTTPYAAPAGRYYVALLSNGTTPPTLRAFAPIGNIVGANLGLATSTLRVAVNGTAQTSLPGSLTLASNSATGAAVPVVALS